MTRYGLRSLWGLGGSVVVLLAGCGGSAATSHGGSATPAPVPVTVAYMPTVGALGVAIAQHEGYFTKAGLDVHLSSFETGPDEIDAMASGQIDMGYIGAGAGFLPMKGGAKAVMIDSISLAEGIVVAQGSGVRTVSDLKGKSVLVPLGTTGEIILYEALTSAGLNLSDVTPINITPTAEVAAFLSHRAPAMAGWVPNTTEALAKSPGARMLVSDKTYYPALSLPNIWVASNQFAASHPAVVQRFLWAILQADTFEATHTSEALQWAAQLTGVPAATLQESVASVKWLTASQTVADAENGTAAAWLQQLADTFIAMKELTSVPSVSTYARLNWAALAKP